MAEHDAFLDPRCTPDNLDRFGVRRSILRILTAQVPHFRGRLLDVGCGRMPYRDFIVSNCPQPIEYLGLDMPSETYGNPPIVWDGQTIPLEDASVDCAMATEVLEHCPDPGRVLREIFRVLKPGGFFFFTVPFLWPLHDVPYDEYRYTPFALNRILGAAGFRPVEIQPLGGWDSALGQLIGLWVRRRPLADWKRSLLSWVLRPLVARLVEKDTLPARFQEGTMITGLGGTALKPA